MPKFLLSIQNIDIVVSNNNETLLDLKTKKLISWLIAQARLNGLYV